MTDRREVQIAGEARYVERVSTLRASRAFALMREASGKVPELIAAWTDYITEYRANNVLTLTRTQARLQYPPQPLMDQETAAPLREPARVRQLVTLNEDDPAGGDGGLEYVDNPRAGEIIMLPSPIDRMTEDDWRESGQKLELPRSPAAGQVVLAIFEKALDVAEEHVFKLLALFLMSNEDAKRFWKQGGDTFRDELERRGEELMLESFPEEILELAVIAGELVDEQMRRKFEALGDRAGNALRLVGIDLASLRRGNGQTTSTPPSSTDGDASSDGPTETPSTVPSISSTDSPTTPTENAPHEPNASVS